MSKSLSRTAFLTLLLIAVMMGANHVSARFAFNDGVSVTTAVIFRSGVTALIITLLLITQRVSPRLQGRQLIFMPVVGTLVAIQSYCQRRQRPNEIGSKSRWRRCCQWRVYFGRLARKIRIATR